MFAGPNISLTLVFLLLSLNLSTMCVKVKEYNQQVFVHIHASFILTYILLYYNSISIYLYLLYSKHHTISQQIESLHEAPPPSTHRTQTKATNQISLFCFWVPSFASSSSTQLGYSCYPFHSWLLLRYQP